MEIAILGDTHMPKGERQLPRECVQMIRSAELVVHTGDFIGIETLELIESLGPPLVAVHGNVDSAAVVSRLPEIATVEVAPGFRLGLIHDAGPRKGRLERLRSTFPDADAVVFGHSHQPLHERDGYGFQIFNPGSPTERRRAPERSMGMAELEPGGRLSLRHVEL